MRSRSTREGFIQGSFPWKPSLKKCAIIYLIDFNNSKKYAVVVQTTMPQDTFFAVKEYLISLGLTLEFYNTICFATKERQQAAYAKYARVEFEKMMKFLEGNKEIIITGAYDRMFGIGFDQYGDKSFQLTSEELDKGALEEIEDTLVYRVIKRAKGYL